MNFKVPIFQSFVRVDVRTRKANSPTSAGTNDLQSVHTDVALNYHLNELALVQIYSKFGLDIKDKIIEPRIQEVVKAVVAKYTAEQLLKQRNEVKSSIRDGLKEQLGQYQIIVEDIQVTDFKFSKAFDDAIEAKQTAEQRALTAKNDLARIEIEAKQRIAQATAEAEAIRIQAQAVQAQGGSDYIELQRIAKWDGQLPQVMGGNTPFVSLTKSR